VPVLLTASLARFSAPADPTQYELGRTTLWSSGIELLSDHPLTGGGIGYGAFLMKPYVNERVSVDYFKDRDDYPAHNPLIEVADDTGVPGLVLYTGAFVAAGWLLVRRLRETRQVLRRHPERTVLGTAFRGDRPSSRWLTPATPGPVQGPPAEVREAKLAMSYLAPLTATAVAVVSTMLKGGGVWDATTTFVLLAMVVIAGRVDLSRAEEPGHLVPLSEEPVK
jgi:O-antigen ligase